MMIVYFLFYLIAYKKVFGIETLRRYECGFKPFCKTRVEFSFRFFLIVILFLIFDVEISLILVIPYVWERVIGVWVFLLFFIILIVGLLYEIYYGALVWIY